jgi:hypothetical protein
MAGSKPGAQTRTACSPRQTSDADLEAPGRRPLRPRPRRTAHRNAKPTSHLPPPTSRCQRSSASHAARSAASRPNWPATAPPHSPPPATSRYRCPQPATPGRRPPTSRLSSRPPARWSRSTRTPARPNRPTSSPLALRRRDGDQCTYLPVARSAGAVCLPEARLGERRVSNHVATAGPIYGPIAPAPLAVTRRHRTSRHGPGRPSL